MLQMVEAENVLKISGSLSNNLLTLAMILSVVYIIYALISMSIQKKKAAKLRHIKKLITRRHADIQTENEKRRRKREKMGM